jgi:hypothetical protein
MASVRKGILIDASADAVWDAIRDFGAVHDRVVPSLTPASRGTTGSVTFFTTAVQRGTFFPRDDEARRLVYTAVESLIGATLDQLVDRGGAIMKKTLDARTERLALDLAELHPGRCGYRGGRGS